MKTIGILGGTSYPSTALYYITLNKMYQARLGGYHSCPLLLHNIDYHQIKSNYTDGWDEIPSLLEKELLQLLSYKPTCVIIANNTLHKAFNLIKNNLSTTIPFLHIIELTKSYIIEQKMKTILLLGTKFTMEDSYFSQPLLVAGIKVITPNLVERNNIQTIQSAIALGALEQSHIDYFNQLNTNYSDVDGIVLACTELPLIYQQIKTTTPLVDTLQIQCKKAIEFILDKNY